MHLHRRRWFRAMLAWVGFVVVVGGLAGLKWRQNRMQIAHAAGAPARIRAYLDGVTDTRNRLMDQLDGMINQPFEQVREAIEPQFEPAHWRSVRDYDNSEIVTFSDPATHRYLQMRIASNRLRGAWMNTPPFVDEPVRFWAVGEQARVVASLLAALFWLMTFVAAWREPWLRRRMGQWSLALAMLASAACWLEPPAGMGLSGAKIPHLKWIVLGLPVMTLLLLVARRARRTGGAPKCPHCSYDLTGNESGICPECGNVTPSEVQRRKDQRLRDLAARIEPGGLLPIR